MAIFSKVFSSGAPVAREAASAGGGVITRWQYDEPSGQTIITRAQDVQGIIEDNKRLQTLNDGYSPSREFRRVARIPTVIAEQWYREGCNILDKNCAEEVRRRLNNSDNLAWRTAPGRV